MELRKENMASRPSENYVAPAVKTIAVLTGEMLCNSRFGVNTHEDFSEEVELGFPVNAIWK